MRLDEGEGGKVARMSVMFSYVFRNLVFTRLFFHDLSVYAAL